jgi:hypothetical protein
VIEQTRAAFGSYRASVILSAAVFQASELCSGFPAILRRNIYAARWTAARALGENKQEQQKAGSSPALRARSE